MFSMFRAKQVAWVCALAFAGAAASDAATYTVYKSVTDGRANFDTVATGAGGTVHVDTWTNLTSGASVDRGDYTITRNNGQSISPTGYGTLSGQTIRIDPALNSGKSQPSGGRADPADYFNSGVTLTFGTAVNSIGFEVGDWATCCHDPVTELFISFDGGAPITVGSATGSADGLFPSQTTGNSVYEIFVGAFDDSGSFSTVSFWGNGLGEVLHFGGQVRYALIDEGGLPPVSPVPLPASVLLLGAGTAALGLFRRRKTV